MFVLADYETGYIVNFEIYTGKKDAPDNKGATYQTVMRLLENHLGQGILRVYGQLLHQSNTLP